MLTVALRGLLGRKLRAVLTAIAIVLGVAMISGTYILTDTIDKAFDQIFTESYAGTSAVISGRSPDISFEGEDAATPPVKADLLPKVRALANVDSATGLVSDESATKILDREGKAVDTQGAPSFGFGVDTSPALQRFNPLKLLEGRWARDPGEVVIDVGTADDNHYEVGDSVGVATLKPARKFELVGVAQYGEVKSIGSATFAVFDVATAQALLDRKGEFDAISAAAKEGVSEEQLVREIRPILPPGAQVRTAQAEAKKESDEVAQFTTIFRYLLLTFAGIALFVGAFVIFNTLSITVAQRTRELATLRTLGASQGQVLRSVVLEAFVIGVLASLVGLAIGYGLAIGLKALFKSLGLDLPETDTVFAVRTIVVSLGVGIVVTVLAGLFPAIRATRVPPIAAMREGATLPKGRLAPFAPHIALVTVAIAIALLAYSLFVNDIPTFRRLLAMAIGVLALFTGVAMFSSRVVPPLAAVLTPVVKWLMVVLTIVLYPISLGAWLISWGMLARGAPFGRRGLALAAGLFVPLALLVLVVATANSLVLDVVIALVLVLGIVVAVRRIRGRADPMEFPTIRADAAMSRLGGENSRRNPGRTAATAAALMIGVALVTFVAVLANGMKKSNRGAIERQVVADYVVTSQDGFTPFPAAAGDAFDAARDTELAIDVRADLGKVAGSSRYVTGIEPDRVTRGYHFDWKDGSDAVLATLGRNGAIVDDDFADDKNLKVGSPFTLHSPANKTIQLVVKATYEPPPFYPLLGAVSISKETFDRLYDRPRNQFTFVNVPGEPSEQSKKSLEDAVLRSFPDAKLQTRPEWIKAQDQDINDFISLLYVLLGLSVVVSIFGMINTLVLSVFERTRELGMLRAVGMTRRQVRRMVRHESVITALIGAALGLPLGILLAGLVTRALSQFEIQFSVPIGSLIVFAVVAMIAGVLAAIAPARRASRLRILSALQYE
jgi:putative ABC transport system permease protein